MSEAIFDEAAAKEWIRPIQDPDMGKSLLDLGLIYAIRLFPLDSGGLRAEVEMTLTSPACPSAAYLQSAVQDTLLSHPQVKEASVKLVFEPKWDPTTMASDEVKDMMGIW
jgi:metal-sulfur cluster biosynthetic enzyme